MWKNCYLKGGKEMKFLTVYDKGGKLLVKFVDENGKEVWGVTTQPVFNYAKSKIEKNEEVVVTYVKEKGQIEISRIEKIKAEPTPAPTQEEPKKEETKTEQKPTWQPKYQVKDENLIMREAVAKATAEALTSLQGHITPNNVVEITNLIFDTLLKKVTEK